MDDWTEEQALEVLADGNSLVVTLPNYHDCDLFVEAKVNGLYEVWLNEYGFDEPIARLPWGEFTVIGFNINPGYGDDAEELADLLVQAGAEDRRDAKRGVN